jgi:hypothetical protein
MRRILALVALLALTLPAIAAGSLTLLKSGSAGAGPITWTFRANTGSITPTITVPASAQAGDWCVLWQWAQNGSPPAPTAVTPTTWTNIANLSSITNIRSMIDARILTGGDPGATITGMDGAAGDVKMVACFIPSSPITSVTVVDLEQEMTGSDPVQQTLTLNAQLSVLALGFGAQSSLAFSGTLATNGTLLSQGTATGIVYEPQMPGVNRTIDIADTGTVNILASFGAVGVP